MEQAKLTINDVEDALINLKQVTLEVTDVCNLRCKYCGYGDLYFGYDKRQDKYLSFDKVKTLIDWLVYIWKFFKTVSYMPTTTIGFYGGEPLMNIDLIKQTVEYVENLKINRNFLFAMTTNAVLLDKYMDYIAEKKFNTLISLDGNSEGQSYRVNHSGRNSFDTVYRNVKLLQQEHPEYFAEHVNFNAVLHNRNSVESTYSFIKNEFGKTPTMSELNNSNIRSDKIEEFNRTYRNKSESLYQSENYEKLAEDIFIGEPQTENLLLFLHQYSGNTFRDYNDLFIDKNELRYRPTGTCTPFGKKIFLTVNGKIIQCERIDHNFAVGNVENGKVNLDFDYIVNRFNAYLDKLSKQCKVCYRKKSCTQCMYYIPDIDNNKPVCHGFMNKTDFENYKSYCMSHLAKKPYLYKKLMTEILVE
ncbi:MAG: radical SAM peptide maturase [Prevotellaceae bacterium]|jgi:uncharacterized protein|nr:radical SAM peptide maturase [Prevotellaceae bacterium]